MTPSTPLLEQGGFNEKLTEVLLDFACDVEDAGKKGEQSVSYLNLKRKEAADTIRTLVLVEIIGEDDEPRNTLEHSRRNFLRAEQRLRLGGTHGTK